MMLRQLIAKLLVIVAFTQPLAWLALGYLLFGDSDMPEIQKGVLGAGMVLAAFILLVILLALADKIRDGGEK